MNQGGMAFVVEAAEQPEYMLKNVIVILCFGREVVLS
jgi:hypothetical protein